MRIVCRTTHRRFWRVEERFVDTLGMIEYWTCDLCHRQWSVALPPVRAEIPRQPPSQAS